MRKLSEIIVEDGIKDKNSYNWVRKASRGIVLKDDKVLMIYSPVFDDYTFPGGGVKKDRVINGLFIVNYEKKLGRRILKLLELLGKL